MAAAVRLTGGVSLFGTGVFGADLVTALSSRGWTPVTRPEAGDGVLVAALWRPSPKLCARIDALGRPWLPVILDGGHLRVGPCRTPGTPPCFACYYRRRLQHDGQRSTTLALHSAYDADPRCGPVGHLPHHVRMAAGLVESVVDHPALGKDGVVTAVRLATGQVTRHHVVPWHNCPRCGPALADPDFGVRLTAVAKELADGR